MEIKHDLTIEYSPEYLKTRNKIALVIDYLEKIKKESPTFAVTNDCISLLLDANKKYSKMYIDLNELPVKNMELRAENHILKVENERLRKEIKELI